MKKLFKRAFSFIRRRWYIFVILAVVTAFLQYQRVSSEKKIKDKTLYKVKRQTLKEELSLSGEVDAEEKVTLRFQSSGRLLWVGVKEGDFVKKYQALASLDQREVQKNLEKALRDFAKERWDLEEDKEVTYRSSVKTDTVRRILEKNQFDLEKAVLDVELKQLSIELSTLTAPIEGIVTRVASPYAGVNVTPAQAEIEIVNPNSVFFSATADQTEVSQIQKGQEGKITLDAYLDKSINSVVSGISFIPKEDETGTVYEVKMTFSTDNSDYLYRLGMTGDVNFVLKERKNVLTVPTSYIKTEKGKKYLWKLENDKKIKTFITVGDEVDGTTEVTSGLQAGDVIQN